MPKYAAHRRILAFPQNDSLRGARLDALVEERGDILFDYAELQLTAPPELCVLNGRPAERVRGRYVPRRLRFPGGRWLRRTGPFERLAELPPEHSARTLYGVHYRRGGGYGPGYHFETASEEGGELLLSARGCVVEERPGEVVPVEIVRYWSPTPFERPRLIPKPARLHRVYGGDPIAIHLRGRLYRHRLFIGGLRHQSDLRPAVDAVLNLCDFDNLWCAAGRRHAADRWACKGEGHLGMDAADIVREARWVVGRLRAGRRVLVHCYAGINRSATICCAALIALEGLSAAEALARVRERHPDAWPDPYHWLVLRWLASAPGPAAARLRALRSPEDAPEDGWEALALREGAPVR